MPWLDDTELVVPVYTCDFDDVQPDPAVIGLLIVSPCRPDGYPEPEVGMRPGLSADDCRRFVEWAEQRLLRLAEHGPEPDGWQRQSNGGLQLWCRLVALPSPA